jgi:hypothetical protein
MKPYCGGSRVGCRKGMPANEHATRVPPQSRAAANDRGYNAAGSLTVVAAVSAARKAN